MRRRGPIMLRKVPALHYELKKLSCKLNNQSLQREILTVWTERRFSNSHKRTGQSRRGQDVCDRKGQKITGNKSTKHRRQKNEARAKCETSQLLKTNMKEQQC